MDVSARNKLTGTVTAISRGGVMAEVTVQLASGETMVSVVTNHSLDRLQLKEGASVTVVVKSTDVMLATDH
jgi:molybdate transport system regulatory protein